MILSNILNIFLYKVPTETFSFIFGNFIVFLAIVDEIFFHIISSIWCQGTLIVL